LRAFLVHIAANRPRLRWPSVLFFSEQFCFLKSCPSFFFILKLAEMFCFFLCVLCFGTYIRLEEPSGSDDLFFIFARSGKLKVKFWNMKLWSLEQGPFLFFFGSHSSNEGTKKNFFVCSVFLFKIYGHRILDTRKITFSEKSLEKNLQNCIAQKCAKLLVRLLQL